MDMSRDASLMIGQASITANYTLLL